MRRSKPVAESAEQRREHTRLEREAEENRILEDVMATSRAEAEAKLNSNNDATGTHSLPELQPITAEEAARRTRQTALKQQERDLNKKAYPLRFKKFTEPKFSDEEKRILEELEAKLGEITFELAQLKASANATVQHARATAASADQKGVGEAQAAARNISENGSNPNREATDRRIRALQSKFLTSSGLDEKEQTELNTLVATLYPPKTARPAVAPAPVAAAHIGLPIVASAAASATPMVAPVPAVDSSSVFVVVAPAPAANVEVAAAAPTPSPAPPVAPLFAAVSSESALRFLPPLQPPLPQSAVDSADKKESLDDIQQRLLSSIRHDGSLPKDCPDHIAIAILKTLVKSGVRNLSDLNEKLNGPNKIAYTTGPKGAHTKMATAVTKAIEAEHARAAKKAAKAASASAAGVKPQ